MIVRRNELLEIVRLKDFKFWRCEALVHFDTSEIFVYIIKFRHVASSIGVVTRDLHLSLTDLTIFPVWKICA